MRLLSLGNSGVFRGGYCHEIAEEARGGMKNRRPWKKLKNSNI